MDLSLLQTLKEKMATAKNFDEVWTYFFDQFGDKSEFIQLGEATEHPFLEQVFIQVCAQLFTSHAVISRVPFTRIAEHHFIHGGMTINGRMGSIIYFEDVQLGMMALAPAHPAGKTNFMRFTGRMAPPRNAEPSRN